MIAMTVKVAITVELLDWRAACLLTQADAERPRVAVFVRGSYPLRVVRRYPSMRQWGSEVGHVGRWLDHSMSPLR
jgi:hypothetical protein